MDAILIALNIIMALALWRKRGCKWFALIQTLQLLEIYPMMHGTAFSWMSWDPFNIAVNSISVSTTKELKWARMLIVIWNIWTLSRYIDRDCDWQMALDWTYWTGYWINNVVLLTLLVYAFEKPIYRLKEHYVRRIYQTVYSPA